MSTGAGPILATKEFEQFKDTPYYDDPRYRPVRMFPWLWNISDFIVEDHPIYHPDTVQYEQYWQGHERICLEGLWGHDFDKSSGKGGYRYMPGNLYYYVNFCVIGDEDEEGNTTDLRRPGLRDVEWIIAYGWMTARGFSGFENDKTYTCCRIIDKIEKKGEKSLSKKELIRLNRIRVRVTDPRTGKYKKYIEAKKYLYHTHKHPKGRALYDNPATNLFVLSSRGIGKSYIGANMIVGHEYNFFGKKYYDNKYLVEPQGVEIFVGSAVQAKSSEFLSKFKLTQEYLKDHHGAWGRGDDFIQGYFQTNSSGSLSPNNSKSPFAHKYKYKEGGVWKEGGSQTKIVHETFTAENPQAAVGNRPTVLVVEEVGLADNLLQIHAANETCLIRKNKFGSAFYIGTGGNMEKIQEPQIIFEDPESYDCVCYDDIWEGRHKPIGLFIPALYVDSDFKTPEGNTDLEGAFIHEMHERKKRMSSVNSFALDGYVMARPLIPSEMFLTKDAQIFPVALLRQRQSKLINQDLFKLRASIGKLEWVDKEHTKVKWEEDTKRKLRPITTYNLDAYHGHLEGAIVIFEHPQPGVPDPTFRRSLHKIVYDPVKDDEGGMSLGCALVYKGFSLGDWNLGMCDTLVAEIFFRYDQVESMHDEVLKLAVYFNAKVMPETTIPDFVRYAKRKKYFQLLQPSPWEAISRVIRNPTKKYGVGVQMTSATLKIHCEQLIRQWLLTKWKPDPNSDEQLTNIDKLYSLRLIEEMIHFVRKKNFDGVSALRLLALWLANEELVEIPEDNPENPFKKKMEEAQRIHQEQLKRMQRNTINQRPLHVY